MSKFLIGEGNEIKVDDILYTADADGVVDLPSEHDDRMINAHGLSRYVPKPAEAEKADAPKAKKGKSEPVAEAEKVEA